MSTTAKSGIVGTSSGSRKVVTDDTATNHQAVKKQRTDIAVEEEQETKVHMRHIHSQSLSSNNGPDMKPKALSSLGVKTAINARTTCVEIDFRPARKKWPLNIFSVKSGVFDMSFRSPTDVLAEAAVAYTSGFAVNQAGLLDCLTNSILTAKHKDVTLKYVKTVLEGHAGFLCYLIITILLAFTDVTLQDTTTELLRRINNFKPEVGTIAPVGSDWQIKAKGVFRNRPAKNSAFETTIDETVLFHLLADLVKCQDATVTSSLRFASYAAQVNPPVSAA